MAPPRGGTRPTTPCRPDPLTRRSLERPTPDPSQERGKYSSASRKFPSWEGLRVGSWAQGAKGNPGSRVRGGGFGAWCIGLLFFCLESAGAGSSDGRVDIVKSANLIYAGSKSSVCFSDKFLATVEKETNITADGRFTPVRLSGSELFDYPFAIMTGEGVFTLLEQERRNLKSYLTRGGFLLASAGCSSPDWDRSFRREFKQIFPDKKLKKVPMDHSLFKTIYDIKTIRLKNGGTTQLEGLEMDGKIVLIYSAEGLNDTPNVKGCCCCGGNEIKNCHEINANVFAYCLTH